mmetsp:Transcript_69324/g.200855  ORF Transcript_69324/g.200855 Transcript_69324/m.200855 type:complete len:124 (+) Transcript_69324:64-435(+)
MSGSAPRRVGAALYAATDDSRRRPPCASDGALLLHCVFAISMAAGVLMLAEGFGLLSRGHPHECDDVGYTWCCVWKDLRCVSSFIFGAIGCHGLDLFHTTTIVRRTRGDLCAGFEVSSCWWLW